MFTVWCEYTLGRGGTIYQIKIFMTKTKILEVEQELETKADDSRP